MRPRPFPRSIISTGLSLLGLATSALIAQAQTVAQEKIALAEPAVALVPKPQFNAEGYQVVGFDQLASFPYTPVELAPVTPTPVPHAGANQIPARIKALDAQKVVVTGFMLPVKMDLGLVSEFLLVKDPMLCCYGIMPKLNEWVVVKMVGKGVAPLMDVPLSFEGKLQVGELYDNGYLTGIYLLAGEKQVANKN